MSNESLKHLVLCAGDSFSTDTIAGMKQLLSRREPGYSFLMSDWVSPDLFERASLLWVVDPTNAPWRCIHLAFEHGLPLLVPEQAQKLKETCIEANCGLFYRDAPEAQACIELLCSNASIRRRLGENGKALHPKHQAFRATTA